MKKTMFNVVLAGLGFIAGALTLGVYLVTAQNSLAQVTTASTAVSTVTTSVQTPCQTFSQTGHTVCGRFLIYWQQHGGLAQQGYPLSEEFTETSQLNGK